MAVVVRIMLSGLCMLVPDPDCKQVHALLPRAGRTVKGSAEESGGGHQHDHHLTGHETHYARIVYDVAHELSNPSDPLERYRSVDVDGCLIEIAAATDGRLDCMLDDHQIMPLDERVCFAGVHRVYVDDLSAGRLVTSRLVLRSGRAAYCHGAADGDRILCSTRGAPAAAAQYTIKEACAGGAPRTQLMAFAVQWHLGDFEGPVTLRRLFTLTPLSEVVTSMFRQGADSRFGDVADQELRPVDGVIDIKLMHVVEDELPAKDGSMKPPTGDGTAHFPLYYDLGEDPPRPQPPRPERVQGVGKRGFLMGANCAVARGTFAT